MLPNWVKERVRVWACFGATPLSLTLVRGLSRLVSSVWVCASKERQGISRQRGRALAPAVSQKVLKPPEGSISAQSLLNFRGLLRSWPSAQDMAVSKDIRLARGGSWPRQLRRVTQKKKISIWNLSHIWSHVTWMRWDDEICYLWFVGLVKV